MRNRAVQDMEPSRRVPVNDADARCPLVSPAVSGPGSAVNRREYSVLGAPIVLRWYK